MEPGKGRQRNIYRKRKYPAKGNRIEGRSGNDDEIQLLGNIGEAFDRSDAFIPSPRI